MASWVIFGCGYVGKRLAHALLDEGHEVRACARNLDKLKALGDRGAKLFAIDGAKRRSFGPPLYGVRDAQIVFSIPPIAGSPPGATVARAAEAAQAVGAGSFVYLGSTAVYGETLSGETVDEDTPVSIGDMQAAPRIAEEGAVDTARLSGLRTVVLRLAAIYGPGRGVRERLLAGTYQLVDEGEHYYSRVHVDDLVAIIRATAERATSGATYCVADDRPSTQREYVEWLCARLALPLPKSVRSLAPGAPRRPVRNRRVSNARLHQVLNYTFRYPSYVEGEAAIEAEAARGTVSPPPVIAAPVIVPGIPAPPVEIASPRIDALHAAIDALERTIDALEPSEKQRVASVLAALRARLGA
jgi:nucleoside-diphosphate-sugar epimerase